jgi:hypothetical protein
MWKTWPLGQGVQIQGEETGQTHVIEEEEARLLLVESSELERFPALKFQRKWRAPLRRWRRRLYRDTLSTWRSRGVFAQIREEGGAVNSVRWVVNTGATNHMSGMRVAFSDLDICICGTVRFNNSSVVRIEGCGTIISGCKNGEHLSFSDIYYTSKLKMNILSVGQLD